MFLITSPSHLNFFEKLYLRAYTYIKGFNLINSANNQSSTTGETYRMCDLTLPRRLDITSWAFELVEHFGDDVNALSKLLSKFDLNESSALRLSKKIYIENFDNLIKTIVFYNKYCCNEPGVVAFKISDQEFLSNIMSNSFFCEFLNSKGLEVPDVLVYSPAIKFLNKIADFFGIIFLSSLLKIKTFTKDLVMNKVVILSWGSACFPGPCIDKKRFFDDFSIDEVCVISKDLPNKVSVDRIKSYGVSNFIVFEYTSIIEFFISFNRYSKKLFNLLIFAKYPKVCDTFFFKLVIFNIFKWFYLFSDNDFKILLTYNCKGLSNAVIVEIARTFNIKVCSYSHSYTEADVLSEAVGSIDYAYMSFDYFFVRRRDQFKLLHNSKVFCPSIFEFKDPFCELDGPFFNDHGTTVLVCLTSWGGFTQLNSEESLLVVLNNLCSVAMKLPSINFCINFKNKKEISFFKSDFIDKLFSLNNVSLLDDSLSTVNAISQADIVISNAYTSTVFEALSSGRPSVIFDPCHIAAKPMVRVNHLCKYDVKELYQYIVSVVKVGSDINIEYKYKSLLFDNNEKQTLDKLINKAVLDEIISK